MSENVHAKRLRLAAEQVRRKQADQEQKRHAETIARVAKESRETVQRLRG